MGPLRTGSTRKFPGAPRRCHGYRSSTNGARRYTHGAVGERPFALSARNASIWRVSALRQAYGARALMDMS
eukprot:scaffold327383_cov59-Tisochrysis_lutea.AAC.2